MHNAQLLCLLCRRILIVGGSDPTAAGGGRREGSEWQRSKKSRKSVSPMIFSGTANRAAEPTKDIYPVRRISSPASATKENTTHSGGVFFGYEASFKRPPGYESDERSLLGLNGFALPVADEAKPFSVQRSKKSRKSVSPRKSHPNRSRITKSVILSNWDGFFYFLYCVVGSTETGTSV